MISLSSSGFWVPFLCYQVGKFDNDAVAEYFIERLEILQYYNRIKVAGYSSGSTSLAILFLPYSLKFS